MSTVTWADDDSVEPVLVLRLTPHGAQFVLDCLEESAPDNLYTARIRNAVEQAKTAYWRRSAN